jgi:3-phosphoshikimate 1-carboxyvinyltransferase
MAQYLVKETTLSGKIVIPSSKSHTMRSILFGTLGNGKSIIHRYLPSSDTQAMIEACRLFGATINVTLEYIEIEGVKGIIQYAKDIIHAGNSGIVLRFCSALGALGFHPIVITGDHSIKHCRPMQTLLDALSQLKVSATSMRGDGFAPIIVHGPIQPGKITISGEDSQPVSALLIASAFAKGPIDICVKNPGERPWVALTLKWFDKLRIPYENKAYKDFRLLGNARYPGFEYTVPGDFSSAAFPIAAALVTRSEITIENLDMADSQGDKALISVFQKMGADIIIEEHSKILRVRKSSSLFGITIDINNFIDAITILAVVACFAEGKTVIYNGAIAKQKECNRIQCIATELKKMGANITESEDGLEIRQSSLKGAEVQSYNDHRMAMSLVVAALGAEGKTVISSIECISKTFPTFMRDFNMLGANIICV